MVTKCVHTDFINSKKYFLQIITITRYYANTAKNPVCFLWVLESEFVIKIQHTNKNSKTNYWPLTTFCLDIGKSIFFRKVALPEISREGPFNIVVH